MTDFLGLIAYIPVGVAFLGLLALVFEMGLRRN